MEGKESPMGTELLLEALDAYTGSQEPEKEPEVEPRVVTSDVCAILRRVVRPEDPDSGAAVSEIADNAKTSTRTVYRVLSITTETISLDLADRLCLAGGAHLSACRLAWPDGTVTPYF